jgi:hypothetical protein
MEVNVPVDIAIEEERTNQSVAVNARQHVDFCRILASIIQHPMRVGVGIVPYVLMVEITIKKKVLSSVKLMIPSK